MRLNHRFGGHAVIRKTLARAIGRVSYAPLGFTLLDIGCASGDVARTIPQWYPKAQVTSLDHNQVNIDSAPAPKLVADAFQLPFQPQSFDFVLCSLFLHHFTDGQATSLLTAFYEIARKALVVCDLERHLIPYIFLPATRLLFGWDPVTVHDGTRSVRAGFRYGELLALAQKAGIPDPEVVVHRPAFRLALVARKGATARV